jgi:hypothetical protein
MLAIGFCGRCRELTQRGDQGIHLSGGEGVGRLYILPVPPALG